MVAARLLALRIAGVLLLCIVCECIEQKRLYSRKPPQKAFQQYAYVTEYFEQPVDHFGYTNDDTYRMRYLYNDSFWSPDGGPVFFYTGNEGDIELFCENTGFIWDIAPAFKALVVFAEHRYYGKSMPYGNDSFKDPAHLGFLTSEQALADYAVFIQAIKTGKWQPGRPAAQNSPVIVFGGSYGGMLAAWFRMKYPHLADGAIAASAPIWQFEGVTSCEVYNKIVTGDFLRYGDTCVENVRASWAAIDAAAAQGASGLQYLSNTFRTCSPLKSAADVETLKGFISSAWGNIAMVEYPYATNFLNPLPAWPIGEVCKQLSQPYKGNDLVEATYRAVNIFYNYTGQVQDCYDILSPPGPIGDDGWNYQACTEMVMPMCADNSNDFFPPQKWDLGAYDAQCTATYSVTPQPYWVMTNYFGLDVKQASNIVFSNGLLDPWHGGGVLQNQSDSVVAVIISDGAHHLDLRGSNPADTPSVRAARQQELWHIEKWIAQKQASTNQV